MSYRRKLSKTKWLFNAQEVVLLGFQLCDFKVPGGTSGKEPAWQCRMWVRSLGQEEHLGEGMATHSSVLACVPWTEEPGGLQTMGSQRVRLNDQHFHFSSTWGQLSGEKINWSLKVTHQTSFAALLFRRLIWGLGQNWKRRIWMPNPVNFGVCFPETRSFCSWWDLWAVTAGRLRVWCNRAGGGASKELVPAEFHPPQALWKQVLSLLCGCCVVSSRGQQRGPTGQ